MAADTWLTNANSQKRIYQATEGVIHAVENRDLVLLNLCDEFKNVKAIGESGGVRFPIEIYGPKNGAGGNNGLVQNNVVRPRVEVQCAVPAVENSESTEMADMLMNTGTSEGAFEDETTRHIRECTEALAKRLQRYMCVSHGTGRVAVVDVDTTTSTQFVASVNSAYAYGLSGLMANEAIDIYNTDSGGAAQYSSVFVNSVDYETGIVVTDTSMSLTAGWSVYLEGRYGLAINGLRNLIDDGTTSSTIHGQTRATYPSGLNSVCKNVYNGGNAVEITQDMFEQRFNRVNYNGGKIEILYGNSGVRDTFNRVNATLRQWQIANGDGPFSQDLGHQGDGSYTFKGKKINFVVDDNALPRALYGFSKGLMRKYVASPIKFMMKDGAMWSRLIGANGRQVTGWGATAVCQMNIGIQKPSWAFLINGVKDTFMGRDTI